MGWSTHSKVDSSVIFPGFARFLERSAAFAVPRVIVGILRNLAGEDGYSHYLRHWKIHHGPESMPLDRSEWFKQETQRRWSGGPRRCC